MEEPITVYKADEVAIYPSGPSYAGLNGQLQIVIQSGYQQPTLCWDPNPSNSAPPFTHMLGALYQSIYQYPTYPFQSGGPLVHSFDPSNPDMIGETKAVETPKDDFDDFFDLENSEDKRIFLAKNEDIPSPKSPQKSRLISRPLSPPSSSPFPTPPLTISPSTQTPSSPVTSSSPSSSTPSKLPSSISLTPKTPQQQHHKDLPPETYSFKYCLSEISSIQRLSGSPISSTKLRVMLTGGVVLPELYFFEGDVNLFLKKMETFTIFRESEHDPDVFYVTHSGLGRGADKNPVGIADFMKSMNESVQDNLLHIPRLIPTPIDSDRTRETPIVTPPTSKPSVESPKEQAIVEAEDTSASSLGGSEMDFVVIEEDAPPCKLNTKIEVRRYTEITESEWNAYFDANGRLCVDKSVVLQRIFSSGVCHSLRRVVWKFLLGMYPWDSDEETRRKIEREKEIEYDVYKRQWKSFTPSQLANFKKFRTRFQAIQKDVPRTDRTLPFYAEKSSPHLVALENVLVTYSIFNFDLGYCQGMNDLLSPILYVMEGKEAEAFWCFVSFMDRVERYFGKGQIYMQSQLKEVSLLLRQVDPAFHEFLIANHSDNFFFCFRWLLCQFKREYSFQDTMRMWEVMWTDVCAPKFDLFIVFVTILKLRNKILSEELSFDEILKHCNDMSGTLDVEEILVMAEYAFRYWRENVDHLSFPTVDAPLPKYVSDFHDDEND